MKELFKSFPIRSVASRQVQQPEADEQAALFQSYFQHHLEASALLDRNGMIIQVNHQFEELFLKESDGRYGLFTILFSKESRSAIQDALRRAAEGEAVHFQKISHQQKQWLISLVPHRVNNIPLYFYAILQRYDQQEEIKHQLDQTKQQLELSLEQTNAGLWEYDIPAKTLTMSEQAMLFFSLTKKHTITPKMMFQLIQDKDRTTVKEAFERAVKEGETYTLTYIVKPSNGDDRVLSDRVVVKKDALGRPVKLLGTMKDLSDEFRNQLLVKEQQEELQRYFKMNSSGIWSYDPNEERFILWSEKMVDILGITGERFTRRQTRWVDHIHPAEKEAFLADQQTLFSGQPADGEYRFLKPSGEYVWIRYHSFPLLDAHGRVTKLYGTITDISRRKEMLTKINQLSYLDHTTLLPNRKKVEEEISTRTAAKKSPFSVILLRINRFSTIHETIGHHAGEALLKEVAKRFDSFRQKRIFVGSYGEAEFVLCVEEKKTEKLVSLTKSILRLFEKPFFEEDTPLFLSANAGITTFPKDGEVAEDLLRNAIGALNRSIAGGATPYAFHSYNANAATYKRHTLEQGMRSAFQQNEFSLFYQAKVQPVTHEITGAEVLLRWQHPLWGIVPPGEFIAIAEESGFIVELGEWVIEESCRQLNQWKEEGIRTVPLSINVSPKQLLTTSLYDCVVRNIRAYNLAPSMIELELTESSLITNMQEVMNTLGKLREIGVKISLDDFGTGYSSLTHLRTLAVDSLKIDRSFIRDVHLNESNAFITDAILAVCQKMQITVVAEGVETKEELDYLIQRKCPVVQGYYFSRPVPADQFVMLVKYGFTFDEETGNQERKLERRKYFRLSIPRSLAGTLSIVEIQGEPKEMGRLRIAIRDIGVGGLCFHSNILLPVRKDITLQFTWKLVGIESSFNGTIAWRKEEKNGLYRYGVEFAAAQSRHEQLIKQLNQAAILLHNKKPLDQTSQLAESVEAFLQKGSSVPS